MFLVGGAQGQGLSVDYAVHHLTIGLDELDNFFIRDRKWHILESYFCDVFGDLADGDLVI